MAQHGLLLGFLGSALLLSVVNGQFLVPCVSDTPSTRPLGPPLPILPDQFQMRVEANIVQKKLTLSFKEIYDYNGNRGVIENYDNITGQVKRTIIDFNEKQAKVIFPNRTCIIVPTNASHGIGYMSTPGGGHIKTAKDYMYFGDDKGEVYAGETNVRGIPVHHWTACAKSPIMNGSFSVDYYFTKVDQMYPRSIPVRMIINGTGIQRIINGTVQANTTHSFYHVYEFFEFIVGPVWDNSSFQAPIGTVCQVPGKQPSESAPIIPKQFSAGVERLTILGNGTELRLTGAQVYVMPGIYRTDLGRPDRTHEQEIYGRVPVSVVDDYKTGIYYTIDQMEGNCTVKQVRNTGYGNTYPSSPLPSLLAEFSTKDMFTYQGKKMWRGVTADSWGAHDVDKGTILELFYQEQNISSVETATRPNVTHYQPIGAFHYTPLTKDKAEKTTYEHIYNFIYGHPHPDAFDISGCFSLGHHFSTLNIIVDDTYAPKDNLDRVIRLYRTELIAVVRAKLASAAKVSAARITSITVRNGDSAASVLHMSFKLLDNTVEGHNKPIYHGIDLSAAINNLIEVVQKQRSLITMQLQINSATYIPLILRHKSLWESSPVDASTDPTTYASSISHYSSASMAGLGIGMLIIGALLGLLASFIIVKKIDASVPYQVQS